MTCLESIDSFVVTVNNDAPVLEVLPPTGVISFGIRRHGGVDSAPTDGPNSHRPAGQPTSWRRRRGRGGRPTGRPTDSPAVQRRRRVPLGPLATRVKLWSTRPGETWRTSRAFRIFRSAGGDATATNRLTAPPTQLPAVQHKLNDPLDPGVA